MTAISSIAASAKKWFREVALNGLLSFRLNLEPAPASRPRVGKFGTYYPKTYTLFRKAALPQAQMFDGVPTDQPVAVLVETVCSKPKTGKLQFPRGDVDNYAKGPLDVMTEAQKFWNDDNQVVALMIVKRYTDPGESAGINIEWFPIEA